ncbi:MAG: non-ribosomal peptide synthetase, partial [Lysobacteraceae bacterium]
GGSLPIGRPIANTRIYILDGYGSPAPIGVSGEIFIGGAGVARGYLNRADLTAERFVEDPYAGEPGARMYKTGDLGRWLPDGNIEYLGRNDFQVKVRGFRIELGEIEAKLQGCAGVREAVVLAREDVPGEKRLVGYVVPEAGETVSVSSLREQLQRELPEYMVPSVYVVLERLPLTPNGKVDRKGLPSPEYGEVSQRVYEAPLGEVEEAVAGIWSELLGLERVGREDDFFELGGHSLLAIKMIHAIKARLNVAVPLSVVFSTPTVLQLAALIGGKKVTKDLVVPIGRESAGPTIFCIHPVGGQISFYYSLARHLTSNFSVKGIRAPESIDVPVQHSTLKSMAQIYGRAIREAQPIGPYKLLGWSTGGLMAAAVAEYLTEQGEEVDYLGLIDTYCIDNEDDLQGDPWTMYAAWTELRSRGFALKKNPRDTLMVGVNNDALNALRTLLEAPYEQAKYHLEKWLEQDMSAEVYEHIKMQLPVTRQHLKVLSGYIPRTNRIPVHRIWASMKLGSVLDQSSEKNQWSEGCAIQTDWIDTDHYGLIREPFVTEVSAAILRFISGRMAVENAKNFHAVS